MAELTKKRVSFLYRSPQLSGALMGAKRFTEERNLKDYKKTKNYLLQLDQYKLFHPSKQKFQRRKYVCFFADYMWQADLIILDKYAKENNGFKAVLIIIDCFTRKFAY